LKNYICIYQGQLQDQEDIWSFEKTKWEKKKGASCMVFNLKRSAEGKKKKHPAWQSIVNVVVTNLQLIIDPYKKYMMIMN